MSGLRAGHKELEHLRAREVFFRLTPDCPYRDLSSMHGLTASAPVAYWRLRWVLADDRLQLETLERPFPETLGTRTGDRGTVEHRPGTPL